MHEAEDSSSLLFYYITMLSFSFLLISRRLELQKRVKEQRETPPVKREERSLSPF
jgi:hypothetical protein